MSTQSKNRRRFRSGNALVEFALTSVILIPLFFGTFQFGYTFYIYNLLCTQMRAGARYGSMRTFGALSQTAYKTAVQNMVLCGNPTACESGTVVEPGLTAANILVQVNGSDGLAASATNIPVTVTVSTATDTPYVVDALFAKFTFAGKPVLKFSYTGRFAPAE